jgi:hypothetical protein
MPSLPPPDAARAGDRRADEARPGSELGRSQFDPAHVRRETANERWADQRPKHVEPNGHAACQDDRVRVEQGDGARKRSAERMQWQNERVHRARVARARSFDEVGTVVGADAPSGAIERPTGTVQLEPLVPILPRINEIGHHHGF